MSRNGDKIACPKCGGYRSAVRNVRQSDAGVYRRRLCLHCQHRYSTEETVKPYATPSKKIQSHHNI
jgi:transcriptional regulator NrdR family protein